MEQQNRPESQLRKIKHHFIDFLNPNEKFNASQFSIEASKIISDLQEEGKSAIIVGGSGLYIRALIDGILNEVETDEAYRDELYELRKQHGNEFLYQQTKKS